MKCLLQGVTTERLTPELTLVATRSTFYWKVGLPPVMVSTKFLSLTVTADNRFIPCNFLSLHQSESLKVGELVAYLSNSWEERW